MPSSRGVKSLHQYLPLGLVLAALTMRADDATSSSSPDPIQSLGKVVVVDSRLEQGEAIAAQQEAPNIISVVTSTEIQRLPDVNAAEALRRVPGISLWMDTGEGRFVAIRGLDSDLNSTTFEGIRLLPTNPATIFGGGRAVALDVIPAGLVGSMLVTKTNKPEQDAEALGGTVDISPKSIPTGHDSFTEVRIGTGYETQPKTPITDLSLTTGGRFGMGGANSPKPFSLVVTASVYNDARGINDVEPAPNDLTGTDRSIAGYDQRYYCYHRFRHAFGGELGFSPDAGNRYTLSYFYTGYIEKKLDNILTTNFDNNFTTADNRVFTDTISDGAYQRALVNHQERLTDQILIFSGQNNVNGLVLDYKAAHMTGEYKVLKDATTSFNSVGSGTVTYNNGGDYPIILSATGPDKTNPANYTYGGVSSSLPLNKTSEDTFLADLSVPVTFIPVGKDSLKGGLSYRDKTYDASATYLSGPKNASVGSPAMSGFTEGSNVTFYNNPYSNGPDLSPALTDQLVAQGGLAPSAKNLLKALNAYAHDKERVSAAYLQYDIMVGAWDILAGFRVEDFKGTYGGNLVANKSFVGPVSFSSSHTEFFPAASVKYDIAKDWDVRLSRSTTIGRPGFNQVSANTQVDTSGRAVTTGNPNLSPTRADSYDLALEHYMGKTGLFTVGFFYKDLKDYIVSDVAFLQPSDPRLAGFGFTGNRAVAYQTFTNTPKAHAGGLEADFEEHLTMLPGLLSGLGFGANTTLVDSSFDIRPGETHALPSTAKATYNVSVTYDYQAVEVTVGIAHVGKYLSGIGSDPTQDVYTDAMNWLDVGLQYRINRTFGVYLNAKNLTNAPVHYTIGTTPRTIQREFYNETLQAGLTAQF